MSFLPATIEALRFYVYRLDDPVSGKTFYVGKGSGNRAFDHLAEARAGATGDKCDWIRSIIDSGRMPRIIVHRHGLDEQTALHVESALIDAYRLTELTNLVAGQSAMLGECDAEELNALYGPPAELTMPTMLTKIERQWAPGLTPQQLYQRTRMYWVANPWQRSCMPTHVAAVARGVIREIYRVDKWWKESDRSSETNADRAEGFDSLERSSKNNRIGFDGVPDQELAHFRGCSVPFTTASAQNSITYVNC